VRRSADKVAKNSLLNVGRAEDIAEHGETKAMKLEEKLRVVANNLNSLEASEKGYGA